MRHNYYFQLLIGLTFVSLGSISVFFGQTRNSDKDFKVRYKTSVGGAEGPLQAIETVTMIKGARERSETHSGFGYDTIQITQCDLKRTIQISDSSKKYIITPMDTGDTSAPVSPGPTPTPTPTSSPVRRGGVVEYVISSVDTGERKEMFGFTARHIKSTNAISATPDACNPGNKKIELDGWYIDLSVEFSCESNKPPMIPTSRTPTGGCRDQVKFRREGNARLGYPLIETTRMYGADGRVMFTQTKEVVELTRASLDVALFDIPAGYTQATDTSELYGRPSMAAIMAGMNKGSGDQPKPGTTTPSVAPTKRPGSVLIGVAQFNNKAGRPVSLDTLRQRLIAEISEAGFDAVPLNATSQMEADAEAKLKQCDFVVVTDVATLKMGKLGMFGSIAGVQGMAKTDAKLEFKLFAVGESAPRLQSSASAKEEGDENSAGVAVDAEAKAVVAEVKKRRG